MKLAILGCEYCALSDIMHELKYIPDIILSNGDKNIKQLAEKNHSTLLEYIPEYKKYNQEWRAIEANYERIIDNCDCVIVFSFKELGLDNAVIYAKRKNKTIKIVQVICTEIKSKGKKNK